jgi:hypothetical protein
MTPFTVGTRLLALLTIGGICLLGTACDLEERVGRLEKQTQELQAEVKKDRATADYDLQAKCSKDAKAWFKENWPSDKDTLLLDYKNHYNKASNKCFIFVEYHFSKIADVWTNDITLWDVYENLQYGDFTQNHISYRKPDFKTEDVLVSCKVSDKTCKTAEEFNGLVRPYMSN